MAVDSSLNLGLLDRFVDVNALVVGDAMRDIYAFGHVDRISPEAPVPIFVVDRYDARRGGSGNVLSQLIALGCRAQHSHGRFCIKKRSFVGSHMVFRCDEDHITVPTELELRVVRRMIDEDDFNVIVLSDYAKGWVSEEMCHVVINLALQRKIPVVVDPKGSDWLKYAAATVICPNEKEWEAVHCVVPPNSSVVAKHGDKGLALCSNEETGETRAQLFPAKARHVYDVTGAGDTVVALVAAVLAAGGTMEAAAQLAVLASGYVVGEVGTTVCPLEVLRELVAEHEA